MKAAKLAGPATLSTSGGLLFVALFFGDGISANRLFWLGSFATIAAVIAIAAGPVPVPAGWGLVALGCLALLAAWVGTVHRTVFSA